MVTHAYNARHDIEVAMTLDDDPWNPKAQRHSAISESHDYEKFLMRINMSVISWNGPFCHLGKENTFPSYPIGAFRLSYRVCTTHLASERGRRHVSERGEQEKNVCTARRPPRWPTVELYHLGLVHTYARSISC